MNLKVEISLEEFKELESDGKKLDVIYSALVVQQKHCDEVCDVNDTRFVKLEKNKLKQSGIAALMGTISGFVAGLIKPTL